jgi:hypothetical protein
MRKTILTLAILTGLIGMGAAGDGFVSSTKTVEAKTQHPWPAGLFVNAAKAGFISADK